MRNPGQVLFFVANVAIFIKMKIGDEKLLAKIFQNFEILDQNFQNFGLQFFL